MSLIRNLTRRSLGLEEMAEEVQPIEGELEQQILEVVEAQAEAEQHEEVVQRLETSAVALEAFAIQIENMQGKGLHLSRISAAAMQIGVEAQMTNIGYDLHKTPSLESFDGETDAVENTGIALEGLKETLMAIWKGIKDAIKRAIDAVLAFVGKLVASVPALDARARKLAIEARKTKGEVKAGAKLNLSGSLSYDGHVSISAIKSGLNATAKVVTDLSSEQLTRAKKYYAELAKAAVDISEKKEVDTDAVEAEAKTTTIFIHELLGGKAAGGSKESNGFLVGMSTKSKGGSVDVDVPSRADIADIADGARKIASAVKSLKSIVVDIDKAQAEAVKAAEALVSASDDHKFGKVVDSAKARWALRGTQTTFSGPLAKLAGVAVRGAFNAVIVGEKALKHYGSTVVVKA